MFDPIVVGKRDERVTLTFFTKGKKIVVAFGDPEVLVDTIRLTYMAYSEGKVIENYFEQGSKNLGFFVKNGNKVKLYFRQDDIVIDMDLSMKFLSKIMFQIVDLTS